MIETGARLVESDRPITSAVARVNDLQFVEPIAGLQDERRLFGHDQRVEAAEEIEIVAINEQLLGRHKGFQASGHHATGK